MNPAYVSYSFDTSDLADGHLDESNLRETVTRNVRIVMGYELSGTTHTLYFHGPELDASQQAALADLVANHDAKVREKKLAEIDKRTVELMEVGFEYPAGSGQRFPATEGAKINLLGVSAFEDDPAMVWPVNWNTIEAGVSYAIPDAATYKLFRAAAFAFMRSVQDSGTALRDQVEAASTPDEILAIVDDR